MPYVRHFNHLIDSAASMSTTASLPSPVASAAPDSSVTFATAVACTYSSASRLSRSSICASRALYVRAVITGRASGSSAALAASSKASAMLFHRLVLRAVNLRSRMSSVSAQIIDNICS